MTSIYNFTQTKDIYFIKTQHFAALHRNFKHQGQFQLTTTLYIYIPFV